MTLTFNLPEQMFQMALLLVKVNNCADQSTCLCILIKCFLRKKNAPTRPEDSINRIAPTDQTARVHKLPQFSLKYRTEGGGVEGG